MDKKPIKVKCSFCAKEMDCPEDMKDSKKHVCFECFQKVRNTLPDNPEKVHIEVPESKLGEVMPDMVISTLMEKMFPEVWQDRKSELKGMPTKDIAAEMFAAGAGLAVEFMVGLQKYSEKKNGAK